MAGELKGLRLIVTGVVQGVGFRYFVKRVADELRLVGYVRNNFDGSVETYVEGDVSMLNAFYDEIKIGPRHAHIASVQVEWNEYKGDYKVFRIML